MPGIAIKSLPRRNPLLSGFWDVAIPKHSMAAPRVRNSFAGQKGLRYNAAG